MFSLQERRWRALGAHIQRLGGVLSAEEMAPFLDPPPLGRTRRRGSEKYEDESFVLPALIRFNGEPLVDDEGRLLYKFPDLQVSVRPSQYLSSSCLAELLAEQTETLGSCMQGCWRGTVTSDNADSGAETCAEC
jgi:hypothetical protein